MPYLFWYDSDELDILWQVYCELLNDLLDDVFELTQFWHIEIVNTTRNGLNEKDKPYIGEWKSQKSRSAFLQNLSWAHDSQPINIH